MSVLIWLQHRITWRVLFFEDYFSVMEIMFRKDTNNFFLYIILYDIHVYIYIRRTIHVHNTRIVMLHKSCLKYNRYNLKYQTPPQNPSTWDDKHKTRTSIQTESNRKLNNSIPYNSQRISKSNWQIRRSLCLSPIDRYYENEANHY